MQLENSFILKRWYRDYESGHAIVEQINNSVFLNECSSLNIFWDPKTEKGFWIYIVFEKIKKSFIDEFNSIFRFSNSSEVDIMTIVFSSLCGEYNFIIGKASSENVKKMREQYEGSCS